MLRVCLRGLWIVGLVVVCWLMLQAVHELGHVAHAWYSEGRVVQVVLHPLAISRTDVEPNPYPHFVAWGGVVWGCLIPLAVLRFSRKRDWPITPELQFFAGFCLIAQGLYLGLGPWYPVGDARDLMELGTPAWALVGWGGMACMAGVGYWHELGSFVEFARFDPDRDRKKLYGVWLLLLLIVTAELALSPSGLTPPTTVSG